MIFVCVLVCWTCTALVVIYSFFFFKQKTAYEMLRSLVGSEMCIRDRSGFRHNIPLLTGIHHVANPDPYRGIFGDDTEAYLCLLYTSDAADDLLCVDLGGRRIIKKKNKQQTHNRRHMNTSHSHRNN